MKLNTIKNFLQFCDKASWVFHLINILADQYLSKEEILDWKMNDNIMELIDKVKINIPIENIKDRVKIDVCFHIMKEIVNIKQNSGDLNFVVKYIPKAW